MFLAPINGESGAKNFPSPATEEFLPFWSVRRQRAQTGGRKWAGTRLNRGKTLWLAQPPEGVLTGIAPQRGTDSLAPRYHFGQPFQTAVFYLSLLPVNGSVYSFTPACAAAQPFSSCFQILFSCCAPPYSYISSHKKCLNPYLHAYQLSPATFFP